MPDRPSPLLRRAGFAAAAATLAATFALSLSAIATIQGTLRPDGEAAAVAAQQQRGQEHGCRGAVRRGPPPPRF